MYRVQAGEGQGMVIRRHKQMDDRRRLSQHPFAVLYRVIVDQPS